MCPGKYQQCFDNTSRNHASVKCSHNRFSGLSSTKKPLCVVEDSNGPPPSGIRVTTRSVVSSQCSKGYYSVPVYGHAVSIYLIGPRLY